MTIRHHDYGTGTLPNGKPDPLAQRFIQPWLDDYGWTQEEALAVLQAIPYAPSTAGYGQGWPTTVAAWGEFIHGRELERGGPVHLARRYAHLVSGHGPAHPVPLEQVDAHILSGPTERGYMVCTCSAVMVPFQEAS